MGGDQEKKKKNRNPPKKVQIQENGRLRLVVPPLLYYTLKNKNEKLGKERKNKKENKRI